MRTFQNHFKSFKEECVVKSWWNDSIFLVDGRKEQFQIIKHFQNTGRIVSVCLFVKYDDKSIEQSLIMKKTDKSFVKSVSKINKISVFHLNQKSVEDTVVAWEMFPLEIFGVNSNWLHIVTPILDEWEKCTFSFVDTFLPLVFW